MKLVIDIPDNKASSLIEVLTSIPNVTVESITEYENNLEIALWQKEIIDERLNDYYKNPSDVLDFDQILKDIDTTI